MMQRSILVVGLLAGLTVPLAVRAQSQPPPDSAQLVAILAVATQANKPAAFVLQHRAALELTPTQVAALEALVQAQRDSAAARQARYTGRMKANPPSAACSPPGTGQVRSTSRPCATGCAGSLPTQWTSYLGSPGIGARPRRYSRPRKRRNSLVFTRATW